MLMHMLQTVNERFFRATGAIGIKKVTSNRRNLDVQSFVLLSIRKSVCHIYMKPN